VDIAPATADGGSSCRTRAASTRHRVVAVTLPTKRLSRSRFRTALRMSQSMHVEENRTEYLRSASVSIAKFLCLSVNPGGSLDKLSSQATTGECEHSAPVTPDLLAFNHFITASRSDLLYASPDQLDFHVTPCISKKKGDRQRAAFRRILRSEVTSPGQSEHPLPRNVGWISLCRPRFVSARSLFCF